MHAGLRSVWQAVTEANQRLRVAVRVHCGHHEPPRLAGPCRSSLSCRQCPSGVVLQGLKLLVTALLARERRQPAAVAPGAPHAEFAAELKTLPSGLLAMVCDAIVRLQV